VTLKHVPLAASRCWSRSAAASAGPSQEDLKGKRDAKLKKRGHEGPVDLDYGQGEGGGEEGAEA